MIRTLIFILLTVVVADAESEVRFGTGMLGKELVREVSYSNEIAGHSIKVLVRQAPYDFSRHKVSGGRSFEGDQPPEDFKPATIDGVEIAGTNGQNPFGGDQEVKMVRDTLREIDLKWNDKHVDVPKSLHINLLGLELAGDYGGDNCIQFVPNPAGDALLIQLIGGEGTSKYLVSLILRKSGKHQQIYHGYWKEDLPSHTNAWRLVEAQGI